MTQQALAARVGLTFQQIQKYERGRNQVSASVLHALAGALGCAPGAFFEGLDGAGRETASHNAREAGAGAADWRALLSEMLAAPGGRELAAAWLAVPPGPVRSRLTALVVAVGDGATAGAEG